MARFTPDDELELLFDLKVIPDDIKQLLPEHLHMRPLASTDYTRNHLSVLSVLTQSPDPGPAAYLSRFQVLLSVPNTYYTIVIIDKRTDIIVAVGCVFMEHKFIRNLGIVGHIEDIAVDKNVQGAKLGLRIIQALTAISESRGAYKTILDCSAENIPFYVKCGYEVKGHEMAKYVAAAPDGPKL